MGIFHLAAWHESQANATPATIAAAPGETLITFSGDDIIIPLDLPYIAGYEGIGANIRRGQIRSPSLLCDYILDIDPLDQTANPNDPPDWHDRTQTPIHIRVNEAMQGLTDNNNTAERNTVGVWLSNGPLRPIEHERIIPIRTTSATTLTVGTWTAGNLTFPSTLPAFRQQLVGQRHHFNGALLGRLRFPGKGANCYAPGVTAALNVEQIMPDRFRYGNMGVHGEFNSREPPQGEWLSTAATASEVVILDLIRIGGPSPY